MLPEMSRDLSGTTVAITGASSGIGKETARLLVGSGANCVLLSRSKTALDDVVASLGPDRAVAVAGDVRDPAAHHQMVRVAKERFGGLDTLIANAGVGTYGGILDGSDDELASMVGTNFLGTLWAIRATVPTMIEARGGDIVIVSSVAGMRGGADEAVYAATKFAQIGLAGAIDRELRDKHIRVTTICPAAVRTAFAIGTGRSAGDPWLDEVLTPGDVASAIVFTLMQPRRMRTQTWSMWSMVEGS